MPEEEQQHTDKSFNPAKDFNDKHSDAVQAILHVPLVAQCKENNALVPYEYSERKLRYQRNYDELDDALVHHGKDLVFFLINNKVPKSTVAKFRGGNLWAYDNQMKMYSKI